MLLKCLKKIVSKLNNKNKVSGKEYDLGVLFVHGIGFQKPGETFNAMYPSIKNEFMLSGNYQYRDSIVLNDDVPEAKAQIEYDGKVKNVLFCESNWHVVKGKGATESVWGTLKRWASNLQAILWLVYFICLRISNARIFGLVFSASLVFLYLFLRSKWQEIQPEFYDMTDRGANIRVNVLWSVLALVAPFIFLQRIWEYLRGNDGNQPWWRIPLECIKNITLYGGVKKAFQIFIFLIMSYIFVVTPKTFEIFIICSFFIGLGCLLFVIFSSAEIAELWNQITKSADYIRTGDEFKYIQAVDHDFKELGNRCDKIILIAHSMGEYLSYSSIRRNIKDFKEKEIQLISIGGGLGLVSLIGDLRQSNKKNEFSGCKSAILSFGAAAQAFILAVGNIFSWFGIAFDIYRIIPVIAGNLGWGSVLETGLPNPIFPFETEIWSFNVGFHFALLVFFAVTGMYVEKISGIKMIGSNNFKFFRYSHFWDPVGNSAGFYYGRSVEQTITPYGGVGHAVRTYYTGKNIRSAKVYYDKDIYIPKRTVQHIVSTVYEKSSLLHKKTKPTWNAFNGIISWVFSSFILVQIMGLNPKLIIVLLPLLGGFNYIVLSVMQWIWVVIDVLRDSSNSIFIQSIWQRILLHIVWVIFCTFVNVPVGAIVMMAIDNILSI